jgi:hypothetical protein
MIIMNPSGMPVWIAGSIFRPKMKYPSVAKGDTGQVMIMGGETQTSTKTKTSVK